MYSYIFLTHGDLGKALLDTAGTIMGEDFSQSCSIYSMDFSMAQKLESIKEEIQKDIDSSLGQGKKVIIFVDLFGGSPSNVAFTISKKSNVDVVSGINLAMVMYAFEHINGNKEMDSMVSGIIRTGSQNITSAKKLFDNNAQKDKG
jgi:mannose PTS system EIIA component